MAPRWTRVKKRKNPEKKKKEPWEKYLHNIYFDPQHPASYKGIHKLHQAVQEEGKYQLTLKQIKQWLHNQQSFSLHKPLRRQFKRLKVIVGGLRDQYEADLADMQKLHDLNDGTTFLLVVIDVFSRHLWVEPLRGKGELQVLAAFKKIFQRAPKPRRLRTDRGPEFKGSTIEKYFDEQNIEHWSAHNDEMKANYAERVIRTLKGSIWGYMRHEKKYRYIDVLQKLVDSYNNTTHRSTRMKPIEVTRGHVERRLWWHLYKPTDQYKKGQRTKRKHTIKVDDYVRISQMPDTFERAHTEKWTREIFRVRQLFRRVGLPKYRLVDLTGEELKGTYYEGELQKVSYSDEEPFEVEALLEEKKVGKNKQILVKWKGWPNKFNSWVNAQEIK